MTMKLDELKKPFPKDKIHWRVGARTKDKSKGIALAYIDARDVMERLDDVVGSENWQAEYPFAGCCRVGIKVGGDQDKANTWPNGEWVWKSNGAGETDVEGEKGQYSDAFKRAAVLWGIGRYLYDLPNEWVPLENDGKKLSKAPNLPNWALPGAKISKQVQKEFHDQVLACLVDGDGHGVEALWSEWDNDEKVVLWSLFNSKERSAMKKIQEEARS